MPLPGLTARVWSPHADTDRILVAHDGPEYDGRGRLGDYTAAVIGSGRVRPYHLVLLPPIGNTGSHPRRARQDEAGIAGSHPRRARQDEAGIAGSHPRRVWEDQIGNTGSHPQTTRQDETGIAGSHPQTARQGQVRKTGSRPRTVRQGGRERIFAADPGYARFLAWELLPRIRARLGGGPVVGAGVSLGALAMLHAQWRFPVSFAGLFLQSGSYFQARLDGQEAGFRLFRRIVRFTGLMRHVRDGPAIPVSLTCGSAEENLANNRDMADALRKQGYAVDFAENPDAHTWTGWRDALHPHLTGLLRRVWI
ncbi:alpha/beta hydrolase [Actinoplanes sichuanensis]|uniref:alpha/beta hydrolase n=1 Tax=Actinoplanes sichuanensis TaxID=512349 RepID=UPI00295469A4|nr:hypothetical protein [Actinoplanes sichuanensis]